MPPVKTMTDGALRAERDRIWMELDAGGYEDETYRRLSAVNRELFKRLPRLGDE